VSRGLALWAATGIFYFGLWWAAGLACCVCVCVACCWTTSSTTSCMDWTVAVGVIFIFYRVIAGWKIQVQEVLAKSSGSADAYELKYLRPCTGSTGNDRDTRVTTHRHVPGGRITGRPRRRRLHCDCENGRPARAATDAQMIHTARGPCTLVAHARSSWQLQQQAAAERTRSVRRVTRAPASLSVSLAGREAAGRPSPRLQRRTSSESRTRAARSDPGSHPTVRRPRFKVGASVLLLIGPRPPTAHVVAAPGRPTPTRRGASG
jgi:hypothetical protein